MNFICKLYKVVCIFYILYSVFLGVQRNLDWGLNGYNIVLLVMMMLWCSEVVLAYPYLIGRALLFLKSSKLCIPQYPTLTSKSSFHDVEGVAPIEEFVSCNFIFALWGIKWWFRFPRDESLYDMSKNKVSKRWLRVQAKEHFVELTSRITQLYSFGRLSYDCPEERREPGGELGGLYSLY